MTELVTNILNKMGKDKNSKISKQNIKTIRGFDEYNILKGLKESTRKLQISMILEFSREVGKNYKDVTNDNVRRFLSNKKVKQYTLENWKNILRNFSNMLQVAKNILKQFHGLNLRETAMNSKNPMRCLLKKKLRNS